ncbi:MAG: hypothetical protein Fur0025_06330 [Oscillatoriaceae cyanobacterium]
MPKFIPTFRLIWHQGKTFTQGLAAGADDNPSVSGPGAAAIISAAFSCFVLMINQHLTISFPQWDKIVWDVGSWIPGSKNPDKFYGEIGSYSGQETIMLIFWLASWLLLHQIWKNRQISTKTIFMSWFFFLVAATVMNWHPLFPYMPLMPK